MTDFVHLHLHTHYSVQDACITPEELLNKCVQYSMTAVAITDHGHLNGFPEFYTKFKGSNVKLIPGAELYVARTPYATLRKKNEKPYHLITLAYSEEGYYNLIKLVAEAYMKGFYKNPRVSFLDLEKHSKGLIFLSGCIQGEVAQAALISKEKTIEVINKYKNAFGKNFIVELQYHKLENDIKVINTILSACKQTQTPIVITNDVHYLDKDDEKTHKSIIALKQHQTLKNVDYIYAEGEYYFKTGDEMKETFMKLINNKLINLTEHELDVILSNSARIAEKVNISLPEKVFYFPKGSDNETFAINELRELCMNSLRSLEEKGELFAPLHTYRIRLNYELTVIEEISKKTGIDFSRFFLITHDIVNFAKNNNILVGPGRGSAVGSLIVYLLKITEIDPIQYNLSFSRFLNPDRISMPDIDVDIEYSKRMMVVDFLLRKYGSLNVGGIMNYSYSDWKRAYKDAAQLLGIPFRIINHYTENLSEDNNDLPEEFYQRTKLTQNKEAFKKLAQNLTKYIRNVGKHASGFVIASKPLTEIVPVVFDEMAQTLFVSTDKDLVENFGLLKIDLLGSKTLGVVHDLIEQTKLKRYDFEKDPSLVKEVLENIFSKGCTVGVFQFESKEMQKILRNLKPQSLQDLIAVNALYRPGPKAMIDSYIQKKNSNDPSPILTSLNRVSDILKETWGIIVYQEQVMEIAKKICGFTASKADYLRKIISKKKEEEFEKIKAEWIEGALKHSNIPKEESEKILQSLEGFAQYAFNKAHATAYAILAFRTAALKYKYPGLFYASMLNTHIDDNKKTKLLFEAILSENLFTGEIIPPNATTATKSFFYDKENNAICCPLTAIKGIGENVIESLEKVNVKDIAAYKKALSHSVFETLVNAGAFDELIKEKWGVTKFKDVYKYRQTILTKINDPLFQKTSIKDTPLWLFLNEIKNHLTYYNHGIFIGTENKIRNYYEIPLEQFEMKNSNFFREHRKNKFEYLPEGYKMKLYGVVVNVIKEEDNGKYKYVFDIVDNMGKYTLYYKTTFPLPEEDLIKNSFFVAEVKITKNHNEKFYVLTKSLVLDSENKVLSNCKEIFFANSRGEGKRTQNMPNKPKGIDIKF